MASKPEISVILPVYNAKDSLKTAIQSIAEQTEPDFELIAVDDGSTDQSPDILQRWADKDKRIKPVFQSHDGIVAALNHGLHHAKGRYIARMDADDISLPQRLEFQKNYLDQNSDADIVSTLVKYMGDRSLYGGYARYVDWTNTLLSHDDISLHRFVGSPIAHPTVMFRRWPLEVLGGYREGAFPEDYELWLRWLKGEVRFHKIPEFLYRWADHDLRLSRVDDRYSFEAFYRIKAKYLADWLQLYNPHHPEVVIWGAGRTSRKRADFLTDHGIDIVAYIDIDPNKIGNKIHGRPVWSVEQLSRKKKHFILSYVGRWDVNEGIRAELNQRNYVEGIDYLMAA